jgi:hypothetical protein
MEWERSEDLIIWASLGLFTVDTKTITETNMGNYFYRLKAVDLLGLIGYSNVLNYVLMDATVNAILDDVETISDPCISPSIGGAAKTFKIYGTPAQVVKVRVSVSTNSGSGFYVKIFEDSPEVLIQGWDAGPSGTYDDINLTLDGSGERVFRIQLCISTCIPGYTFSNAAINLQLFNNDNVTLNIQGFSLKRIIGC